MRMFNLITLLSFLAILDSSSVGSKTSGSLSQPPAAGGSREGNWRRELPLAKVDMTNQGSGDEDSETPIGDTNFDEAHDFEEDFTELPDDEEQEDSEQPLVPAPPNPLASKRSTSTSSQNSRRGFLDEDEKDDAYMEVDEEVEVTEESDGQDQTKGSSGSRNSRVVVPASLPSSSSRDGSLRSRRNSLAESAPAANAESERDTGFPSDGNFVVDEEPVEVSSLELSMEKVWTLYNGLEQLQVAQMALSLWEQQTLVMLTLYMEIHRLRHFKDTLRAEYNATFESLQATEEASETYKHALVARTRMAKSKKFANK